MLPVYAAGHMRRLEDIKKLLYAGVQAVFSCEEEKIAAELIREGRERFGEERVLDDYPVLPETAAMSWSDLRPDASGLVPCVVQEEETGKVLMLAYMNEEAFCLTLRTGRMTYWSRSRQEIWVKGLTSGHFQFIRSLSVDCDQDTLLAKVRQLGAACHTGSYSCFYRDIYRLGHENADPQKVLQDVYAVIADRKLHPREGSYTNYLFDQGIDKILKKVGEESAEIIIAAKNPDNTETMYEIADMMYHVMVLMCEKGLTWQDITEELSNRE
ncbi:MAG: bifunctional phosphoribosyl-AMP cyclohydrolase/phosphoribosyl-ATP diphosphatase HisIE [Eubacterium sp.]|nr:bifunctional phosphoribosyl-AMP cyclohydrolase/phosphoribosyl-ATP diphosphatase HisIE [Eubacterium sp.]